MGGAVDTRPEPAGHAGFLLWGWVPEPFTLYRGIRALEAGARLIMEADGRRRLSRFGSIAAELRQAEAAGAELRDDPLEARGRLKGPWKTASVIIS